MPGTPPTGAAPDELEVLPDAQAVAREAARAVAEEAERSVAARGRFAWAVSGGRTPWAMLRELARIPVPWERVHLFQVDERVAPDGHPDRNWTHVRETLLDHVPLPAAHQHPMPVEGEALDAAAARYAAELRAAAGDPPVLDLVHLGLGPDGHTASLVPDDPVLGEREAEVALTQPYQGRRRMTLTFPCLERARLTLWVVTGASKREMLERLLRCDPSIPAGRVPSGRRRILADRAAAV